MAVVYDFEKDNAPLFDTTPTEREYFTERDQQVLNDVAIMGIFHIPSEYEKYAIKLLDAWETNYVTKPNSLDDSPVILCYLFS